MISCIQRCKRKTLQILPRIKMRKMYAQYLLLVGSLQAFAFDLPSIAELMGSLAAALIAAAVPVQSRALSEPEY